MSGSDWCVPPASTHIYPTDNSCSCYARPYRDCPCWGHSAPFSGRRECLFGKKRRPPQSSWARSPETPARVQNKSASADLSPCNDIPAILGQHEACPERDDSERTQPATTPSVRTFQPIHQHFVPLSIALDDYDPSLTYIGDDVVLFWQPPSVFFQWTISPFTVDLVDYTCAEQYMMASKARMLGDDSALSAILATDDPREQKRIGRQVRHFDQDLWQKHCENIVFDGNLAKF